MVGVDAELATPIPVHDEIRLRGWATASSGIASIEARIGRREITPSHTPSSSGEDSRVAFDLTVDTSSWDRGEYPLEIVATDRRGGSRRLAGTVDVLPYRSPPLGEEAVAQALAEGTAAMWYEAPELAGGTVTEDYPEVRGWATAPEGIEAVFVTIDGTLRLPAIHGLARPDLRGGFGDEVAADCGFALRLDPAELPSGRHVLTIVAVPRRGVAIGIAGTVERVDGGGDRSTAESGSDEAKDDLASGERFVPELHRGTSLEPEHHARYRWAAPLVGGRTVLDAGCGVGWGSALLAQRAADVTGVDRSNLAIDEARRRHGDVAQFQLGDLCRLPFEDATFDAVVSFEAIEHVADTELALDEMRRVLRPGGLLLISSPNRGVYPDGNPFHLRELTSAELAQSLQRRFARVAVYRQQTYVASLLGTDAELRLDDASQPLETTTIKLVGGVPGSELYAVAAATDGRLPAAPSCLALGGELDREEHFRMIEPWRDRAARAEVELAKTRTDARRAALRAARLERELAQARTESDIASD